MTASLPLTVAHVTALGVFDGAWAPYASLISGACERSAAATRAASPPHVAMARARVRAVELWSLAAHGAQWSPYGVRVVYDGQVCFCVARILLCVVLCVRACVSAEFAFCVCFAHGAAMPSMRGRFVYLFFELIGCRHVLR